MNNSNNKNNNSDNNIAELSDQNLADAVGGAIPGAINPETGAELTWEEFGRTPMVTSKPGTRRDGVWFS